MIYKVLENFKSYAGEKEIGPFHKCFSSVVGPNGSGKSNVIDAMLFVFGKKAKKLRLNKVSELIHQSETVKDNPPQFARVSVHFQEIVDIGDGDDEYRVVSDSDTVVTRIAKRDSSSVYKLNGKSTSFKEIAAYLNAKGIDLDNNRFLILQGEVEMISKMDADSPAMHSRPSKTSPWRPVLLLPRECNWHVRHPSTTRVVLRSVAGSPEPRITFGR